MNRQQKRPFDILCAGELLIDLISTDYAETFDEVTTFQRIQGGSPANLCMNMARLGNKTKLVASLGNDDMGRFLRKSVENLGVDCTHIRHVDLPTTLVLVTRTNKVANFEAYRLADRMIAGDQFDPVFAVEYAVFHTTCFALSLEPARTNILNMAKKFHQAGGQVSIDVNYAGKIWPDQAEAQKIVAAYCNLGALIKVSEVDWERLYNLPLTDQEKAARHFLDMGAAAVCVTLGSEGAFVASQTESHFLPSRPVQVADTTGAGDAFWSGFLTAWLDGHSLLDCAKAARRMAEIKIGTFGVLPDKVEREMIYVDL